MKCDYCLRDLYEDDKAIFTAKGEVFCGKDCLVDSLEAKDEIVIDFVCHQR